MCNIPTHRDGCASDGRNSVLRWRWNGACDVMCVVWWLWLLWCIVCATNTIIDEQNTHCSLSSVSIFHRMWASSWNVIAKHHKAIADDILICLGMSVSSYYHATPRLSIMYFVSTRRPFLFQSEDIMQNECVSNAIATTSWIFFYALYIILFNIDTLSSLYVPQHK